jgi:hypothetical protein
MFALCQPQDFEIYQAYHLEYSGVAKPFRHHDQVKDRISGTDCGTSMPQLNELYGDKTLIPSLIQKVEDTSFDETKTKAAKPEETSRNVDRGMYHMERWLDESGKEGVWSVYARY